ncbi:MAG: family transcriptional regulator [Rhizobacter sp.]|nr:family transcriptional regulator [Rhizobacter sp.]
MPVSSDTPLGAFLKDCRHRIDPAGLGFPTSRRRTPGLRREEVAQRANISPAWYTWLEQGRGGAPSAEVLGRIASGLMLTDTEREHLFMLGLGHPPGVQYKVPDSVTPRLQRVLDALEVSPAIVKTATWDVVAWNRAAAAVLTDYSQLEPPQRNILRLIFSKASERAWHEDWQAMARVVVASFRADAVRAGATSEIDELVAELCALSPEFEAMWRDNDVRAHGEGLKRLHHATAGVIELEYSSFSVEGRPDLGMIVYNPVASADADRVRSLIRALPVA